jgi:hypothetical protein
MMALDPKEDDPLGGSLECPSLIRTVGFFGVENGFPLRAPSSPEESEN